MTLKNIEKQAVTIDMFYDVGNNPGVDQTAKDGVPAIRNVLVENLTCDGAAQAIVIRGLEDSLIENVTLKDVHVKNAKEGMRISESKETRTTNVSVELAK